MAAQGGGDEEATEEQVLEEAREGDVAQVYETAAAGADPAKPDATPGGQGDQTEGQKSLVIIEGTHHIKKGTAKHRFQGFPEFEIQLQLRLDEVPKVTSNFLNFIAEGKPKVHLPSLSIEGETTCVVARLAYENFYREFRSTTPLNLRQITEIVFGYSAGVATLTVNGDVKHQECSGFDLPNNFTIIPMFCGNEEPPVKGAVSQVEFRWRVVGHAVVMDSDAHQINFELPPTEKRLLEEIEREIHQGAKWAKFDSFFGIFLVLNSIVIGFQTEYEQQIKDNGLQTYNEYMDQGFLCIFIIELLLRIFLNGWHWYRTCLRDPWFIFDTVVISITVFDVWIASNIELPFNMGMLRLLRLLKLAKMVRLVRAFRSLGLLVEGMMHSVQTLFWATLLLVLTLYAGAILLVKVTELGSDSVVAFCAEQCAATDTTACKDACETAALAAGVCGPGTVVSNELCIHELFETWSSVPKSMWRLMQMTTLDNWTKYVRDAAFVVGGWQGSLMALMMTVIVAFSALGIMNMLVGVLCHTAKELDQKQKRMKGAEGLLKKKKAVASFRAVLKRYGQRPLFTSDRFIGTQELIEAISENEELKGLVEELELTVSDFVDLGSMFEEKGQIEIDGLIEAIIIIQLQRYFGTVSTDLFGKELLGSVRPVDMLFFAFSVKEMESNLRDVEKHAMGVCSMVYDVLRCLHERSHQASTLFKFGEAQKLLAPPRGQGLQPADMPRSTVAVGVKRLAQYVHKCNVGVAQAKIGMPMDLVFGTVICINGVFIGIQTELDAPCTPLGTNFTASAATAFEDCESSREVTASWLFWIDFIFTLIFVFEFCLRCILFADFQHLQGKVDPFTAGRARMAANGGKKHEEKQQDSETEIQRVEALKNSMRWGGIRPPMPEGGYCVVLRHIPAMLSDPMQLFDFLIVVFCLLDSVMSLANVSTVDASVVSAFRLFRLLRLVKILRIFRIFPNLQKLVFALMSTLKTIFWTLVLMFIGLYALGIVLVVFIGNNEPRDRDNPLHMYFGNLQRAMLTGWQLVTFDGWTAITDASLEKYPYPSILFGVVMVVLGLGIMNIAVGVMCESAVGLVRVWGEEQVREDLLTFFKVMDEMRDFLEDKVGTVVLEQQMLEAAMGIKFRPTVEAPHHHMHNSHELKQHHTEKHFPEEHARTLRHMLKEAKLAPEVVKQVFEQIDYERTGRLHVETFIAGALEMKEDIAKLSIFASSTAIRTVRAKCAEVSLKLYTIHHRLELALRQMCALIHRKTYVPPHVAPGSTGGVPTKGVELSQLSQEAREALDSLESWHGSGTLPLVKALGKVVLVPGTGELRIADDQVIGTETKFRREVKPGDIIIVEVKHFEGRGGQVSKSNAMVVTAVNTQTNMRVSKSAQVQVGENSKFLVAKRDTKASGNSGLGGADSLTFDLHAPQPMSPRSAQSLFEWEMRTKKHDARKVLELEREKSNLTLQLMELEQELDGLTKTSYVLHAFKGWVQFVNWDSLKEKWQKRKDDLEERRKMGEDVGHQQIPQLQIEATTGIAQQAMKELREMEDCPENCEKKGMLEKHEDHSVMAGLKRHAEAHATRG